MAGWLSFFRKRYVKLPTTLAGQPTKVKVGFPAGKISTDIVDRAIWNHYGTRGGASGGGWGGPIPARPFLLNAMRRRRDKYLSFMKAAAGPILRGEVKLEQHLNQLGILGQGDVQQEIVNTLSPPNSPTTIKMKGSSHPLIDTGEMRQKVTWKVDK